MKLQSVLLALFFLFAFLIPAQAEDTPGQRVILVLDGSGSMRAKINGKQKIDIAKEVVGKIVAGWQPEDELGLVVYGHRKKGECSDIETVKEPGPLNAEDYMAAVKAIEPKGQTPMTDAVKQAAEALQYTEKKATVILVSDGIETCNADPCAVAADLAKAGVELKVHTVGFGLDNKGAVAQLKCLADKTGGTFTEANNADDLLKALQKTVAAAPPPPPALAPEPVELLNVQAHATLADGVEIPKPFQPKWEIRKPDNADGTPGESVDYRYSDDLKIHVEPGTYVLTIDVGSASVKLPLIVEAGKQINLSPVLDAGVITFSAMMDDTNKLTDNAAFWEVTKPDGKTAAYNYSAVQTFLLSAGTYRVQLSLGSAAVEAPVEVKAGEIRDQLLSFGAGKLTTQAVFAENGDPVENGMSFEVRKPDKDGQKSDSLATLYDAKSQFTLPAGPYIVLMKVGIAQAEQPVEIKPGQNATITIDAKAGYLASNVSGATSFVINAGKAGIDGKRKYLTTIYGEALNLAVNEGSYQVQSFKDDALLGEKIVEVKAGERSEVTFP
ncbi:vWA domain-containing protein [Aestuariivirga litoralis]|uniref:vWA domain-containing protein n=1 Tax=Aestuariivirga litoralis TaxID=2650924 RepID=UPI0018C7B634|nr:VWA domain-containing protein [Aestuariivirga litoralis]MBG1233334.1 VWA domain-containing protein [Aestuariivirga litoralis]